MAYWRDNADSYVCSACGYECNNPNQLLNGAGVCPSCKSLMGAGTNAPLTGWVSVKERLPKKGVTVIVCKDGKISLAERSTHSGAWFSCAEDVHWTKGPTHWMPLPEPPEEGTT